MEIEIYNNFLILDVHSQYTDYSVCLTIVKRTLTWSRLIYLQRNGRLVFYPDTLGGVCHYPSFYCCLSAEVYLSSFIEILFSFIDGIFAERIHKIGN